ncbi:Hsp20/alpha crystallin family protein [Ramlibacter montanisoli]|uniref:Hsp20/alpha crystallin family protein n=1 Tax=Ramlibacter montanisoli TaxID=2732512 RepID=A0A849KHS9_9BURK|nr:Hsp20/alpha crystallin family protein [Ramlibacter montanisoli]NNU43623.1 Hsp20/alpha crystallin family protein [Ramlibacter montanisoli]
MNNQVQATSSSTTSATQDTAPERFVVPPVDVYENDSSITLLADLPGVPREQLHVRVDGDNLLLEATAVTSGPENMELVYGEAQCPAYRRQFTLSRELDPSRIEAQLRDGVLRLTIPKAEEARPRRIQVQAG